MLQNAKIGGRGRYLLLGSLTLNLVFAGAAGAMALQHSNPAPLQPVVGIKHGMEHRFDRIAASLPTSDAKIMRAEFRTQAVKLAAAEAEVRLSEEAVRTACGPNRSIRRRCAPRWQKPVRRATISSRFFKTPSPPRP